MNKTTERIQRRLAQVRDNGAAARAKGDSLYAVHNQTMADELQWLLDAAETDGQTATVIASFLTIYAVEFDQCLSEGGFPLRRSQIIEQLSDPRGA